MADGQREVLGDGVRVERHEQGQVVARLEARVALRRQLAVDDGAIPSGLDARGVSAGTVEVREGLYRARPLGLEDDLQRPVRDESPFESEEAGEHDVLR